MTQGEFPVTIAAPPETVWPWVSQLDKHVEWSAKPYSVEWISGKPNAGAEHMREIPPRDPDFPRLIARRNDAEPISRAIEDTFYWVAPTAPVTSLERPTYSARSRNVRAQLEPPPQA